MKLIPIIITIILASSTLGYGIQASAQSVGAGTAGAGGGTPCSASYPCAAICGNHICAPGETPMPVIQTNGSKPASGTNNTGSSVATQVNIATNVTATKNANNTTISSQTMTNMTATKTANGTMTNSSGTTTTAPYTNANSTVTPSTTTSLPSPKTQIVAGAQPQNVKCAPGLYLVLNNIDSRPACVTQNTMSALEARGWGHAAP
ncbi:MAG: hypothetical protein ACREBB_00935 [Nitrosotalea sp.]